MSLNKYEQGLFDYIDAHPEERRHWQAKAISAAQQTGEPGQAARAMERELWEYYEERSQHIAPLRQLNTGGIRRVSLQNLSEYLIRLFGPPIPKRRPSASG